MANPPNFKSSTASPENGQPFWVIWLLSIVPLLGWNFTGLFDLDEGFYGAVVSEMNRRGEWITPFYNGHPWFEKPILLYWLAKPCVLIFGAQWGARLPSVLTTLGLYAICAWFASRNLAKYSKTTVVSILSTSLLVVALGRLMMTDAPLNLALTAAFLTFWESLVGNHRWRIVTAACLGVAVLAKGPVALLLFVPIAGYTFWKEPELRPNFKGSWLVGTLVLAAVISTWYVPAYLINGQMFVQKFLVEQNLGRFSGGDEAHTIGIAGLPIYFFVLLLGLFPTSLFIWKAWPRRQTSAPVERYLAVWAAVIFVFFSLSGAKLIHYVLPVAPPLALLLGHHIAKQTSTKTWVNLFLDYRYTLLVLGILGGAQTWWYGESGQQEAHYLARKIPVSAKVSLFRLSRQNEDRGTGSTQLRETSLPSLMMVLNRTTVDTDSLAEAIHGQEFVFTRTGRLNNLVKQIGASNDFSVQGMPAARLRMFAHGKNFEIYQVISDPDPSAPRIR